MTARAACFDLVGTLIRVRGGIGVQYASHARACGIRADARAIDTVFPAVLASTPDVLPAGRSPEEVAAAEREAWHGVVRRVFERAGALDGAPDEAFEACFDSLFRFFATAAGWEIYADVCPVLDRLVSAGVKLALVTNFDGRVFPLLDSLGLRARFGVVATPGVAGAAKPDPRIFRYAVDRLNVAPGEALHVGDSLGEDVEAASRAGLEGVWIDRRGLETPPAGVRRITALDELLRAAGDPRPSRPHAAR